MAKISKKLLNKIRLQKEREFKKQLQTQKITDLIYIADLPKMLDELFELISKIRLEIPHEIAEYNKPDLLNLLEKNLLDLIEKKPLSIRIINNGTHMAFNTGLVTNHQYSVFMILEINPLFKITTPQQWRFLRFIQVCLKRPNTSRHYRTAVMTTISPKIKTDLSDQANNVLVVPKNDVSYDSNPCEYEASDSFDTSNMTTTNVLTRSTDESYETCPICNGDGGVRGGCYKCSGSGWVSAAARTKYSLDNASAEKKAQDTRISNSSSYGLNAGAHYRERDGRIGSYPSYDDYSEEGDA